MVVESDELKPVTRVNVGTHRGPCRLSLATLLTINVKLYTEMHGTDYTEIHGTDPACPNVTEYTGPLGTDYAMPLGTFTRRSTD